MPQGGIDHGRSMIEACLREMEEEIGTNKAELLREHEEWLHYDIPQPLSDRLWHGKYRPEAALGGTSLHRNRCRHQYRHRRARIL